MRGGCGARKRRHVANAWRVGRAAAAGDEKAEAGAQGGHHRQHAERMRYTGRGQCGGDWRAGRAGDRGGHPREVGQLEVGAVVQEEAFRPAGHQLDHDQLRLAMEEDAKEPGRLEIDATVEEEPNEEEPEGLEVRVVVEEEPDGEADRSEVDAAVEEEVFRPAGHSAFLKVDERQ